MIKLNTLGRDFIFGDLHGCYDLLMSELDAIKFDKSIDRLFSVGDLIDRGSDSVKCLELLNEPWFFAVYGNHEQMMVDAIYYNTKKGLWMQNGGDWAIDVSIEKLDKLAKLILAKMPYSLIVETVNGNIGICHAQPPSVRWSDTINPTLHDIQYMIWGRSWLNTSMDYKVEGIYKTFHGHTPVDAPVVIGNSNFIDTGAVFSGNLTLMELK